MAVTQCNAFSLHTVNAHGPRHSRVHFVFFPIPDALKWPHLILQIFFCNLNYVDSALKPSSFTLTSLRHRSCVLLNPWTVLQQIYIPVGHPLCWEFGSLQATGISLALSSYLYWDLPPMGLDCPSSDDHLLSFRPFPAHKGCRLLPCPHTCCLCRTLFPSELSDLLLHPPLQTTTRNFSK